jgi:hypothetical protein
LRITLKDCFEYLIAKCPVSHTLLRTELADHEPFVLPFELMWWWPRNLEESCLVPFTTPASLIFQNDLEIIICCLETRVIFVTSSFDLDSILNLSEERTISLYSKLQVFQILITSDNWLSTMKLLKLLLAYFESYLLKHEWWLMLVTALIFIYLHFNQPVYLLLIHSSGWFLSNLAHKN